MIIDDEKHAVNGVKAGVRWERLNISEVHVAYNIRQAQEIIQQHPIHVMVCDIEMPSGSGLDLLVWVQANYHMIETIFLTNHADFSYAQQAIDLGCMQYMLKPFDSIELEKALAKSLEKIKKSQEQASYEQTLARYRKLWELQRPLVHERFWLNLLEQSGNLSSGQMKERLLQAEVPFGSTTHFVPVLIRVQRWHKNLTLDDERIMEYALRNAAEEKITQGTGYLIFLPLGNRTFLLLMEWKSSFQTKYLEEACIEYVRKCNEYFFCDLCCYMGGGA